MEKKACFFFFLKYELFSLSTKAFPFLINDHLKLTWKFQSEVALEVIYGICFTSMDIPNDVNINTIHIK